MIKIFHPYFLIFFLASLLAAGCSKSDDQREFEQEALTPPFLGITEMNSNGNQIENGNVDSGDWKIAPNFAGLVSITPAYPNPVFYNQRFQINIDLYYAETVEKLFFYAKDQNSSQNDLIYLREEDVFSRIDTFTFNSARFASEAGVGNSNVYRILIFDGRENLISYGDVRIQ